MRDTAGSATAPAARCKNVRRGSFILEPPFTSFDHLVGAAEQHRRDCQAKRLSGPEIDDELELRRLLHREVGGLFALENAGSEQTSLPVRIEKVWSVACQATGMHKFAPLIYRGPTMPSCEHDNLCALAAEQWIGSDQQPRDGLPCEGLECRIDLLNGACITQH